MERVELIAQPELRQPTMVVAFSGWPNAADVATRALSHLVEALGATPIGSLRATDCYDLTSARPQTRIQEGVVEASSYPSNDLFGWRDSIGSADLVLLSGVEPGFHWDAYFDGLFGVAQTFHTQRLVVLGSLYDRVPRTRPPRISAVVSHPGLKEQLARLGCTFIDYSGPGAIHTSLILEARQRGLDAISLWAHAPHYAHMAWNPRATYALLGVLCPLLGVQPDMESLRAAASYLDEMLEKILRENADLRAHVAELEEEYEAGQAASEALPPLSDSIIRQVEELLQRHRDEPDEG